MNDLDRLRSLFFSGIGGAGMSALAQVFRGMGREVSGSDRRHDRGEGAAQFARLAAQGIVLRPQDGSGVRPGLDAVVVSAAVEADTPDYRQALELGVRVIPRPELLAALVNSSRGVCFSGTSGKSTVSGLAAFVLRELGCDPGFLGGAAIVNYAQDGPGTGNAFGGKSGLVVAEACESDGSLVLYRPAVGAILNIERDHHELDRLLPMFGQFARQCRETLVLGADCPHVSRLELSGVTARIIRCGIDSPDADLRAEELALEPLGARFRVGQVRFASPLPGRYNVQNVLAALAACEALGVARAEFARVLPVFRGVARRFQVVGQARGVTVIDDYAHNPAKVSAVLSAFESWLSRPRLIVVFQPHGYGPTKFFLRELVEAFAAGLEERDLLVLPEIYYAGGTAARDISSRDVAELVERAGRRALYFAKRAEAIPAIAGEAREGDVVLVLGARDDSLSDFCRELLAALPMERREVE